MKLVSALFICFIILNFSSCKNENATMNETNSWVEDSTQVETKESVAEVKKKLVSNGVLNPRKRQIASKNYT